MTVVGVAGPGIRQAFERSWENFVWFAALLVRSIGVVVPLAVLAAVAWRILQRLPGRRGSAPELISLRPAAPHA